MGELSRVDSGQEGGESWARFFITELNRVLQESCNSPA